ncbi:fructosamine kinase family protein [Martelella limonii]|uniref:fructosamine kinase family protein n=1 Tax=Martelella limonii TaxID=1647649 RepID=UPI0015805B67|nr:fructosamine kinase family protein [Martelella limonii]
MNELEIHTARLLGSESVRLSHFSSGDLSALLRAETADGERHIVKTGAAPALEGEMLRMIAAKGAPAPRVIAADDTVLIMEEVSGRSGFEGATADLGHVLRALHAPDDNAYGFHSDFAFGKVVIVNGRTRSWIDFWRDHRLLNGLSEIPPALARRIDRLCRHLGDLIPDTPPPALVHGDLWSGNVMCAGGRVTALIDPACYFGHGEVDLAMAELFGHLDARFFDNYPAPEPGFETRMAVYSLWPALVHLRLFGAGYAAMVDGFLTKTGH